MASISYLLLDPECDPVFDVTATLTGTNAVAQAILTRLKLFLGEWWENLNIGLPVFQSMLGQLGSQRVQTAIQLAIHTVIENTPYVTSGGSVVISFEGGRFTFTATNVQTMFGVVTVSNAPGDSASLGV